MVDYAKIVLDTAITVFNGQKKAGSKTRIPIESDRDVYIVGIEYNDTDVTLCYWKNGQKVTLPSAGYVMIDDFVVSGSDVYVLGSEFADGTVNHCYWKNGSLTTLSTHCSSANSIFILEEDVYIAGDDEWVLFDDPPYQFYVSKACYWKNGTKIELSNNGNANGIVVVKKEN